MRDRRTRIGVRTLLVLACLMSAQSVAWAQATIAGEVRDSSGSVLPGVTVEAASPALIEKVRTAVSGGSGRYRIEALHVFGNGKTALKVNVGKYLRISRSSRH